MNDVPIPYGLSETGYPYPGHVYQVDSTTSWRNEHRYCRFHGYLLDHQSLVYHFSDGTSACYYDFITRDSHGYWNRQTKLVPPGVNAFQYAWDNGIAYWRVEGTPDATLCGITQQYKAKGVILTGWELPPEETPIRCFIQNRSAGSVYLAGELAYCRVGNDSCESTLKLGSLKDAFIALSYLHNILHISIEEAAEELRADAEDAEAANAAELAMQEAFAPRSWVDRLHPEVQDFASQFESEEDFDEYMESRF